MSKPPRVSPKNVTISHVVGVDPQIFVNTFERSVQLWKMPQKDCMKYVPNSIKGELAEVYNVSQLNKK